MSLTTRLGALLGATVVVLAGGLTMSIPVLPAVASSLPAVQAYTGPVANGALAAGGSASDGTRTLTVNRATGLDPSGSIVTVSGSGYDESKGIYVAVCVHKGPGAVPTPCIGGVDMSGGSGGSVWISSNPPPYGDGLAKPYGKGGTFSISLAVVATDPITGTDCRVTTCAVITRNDHTRPQDRSQDLRIPISFATAAPSTSTKTTSQARTTSKAAPTTEQTRSQAVTSTKADATTAKPAPSTSSKPTTAPSTSTPVTSAKPVTSTVISTTRGSAPVTSEPAGTSSPSEPAPSSGSAPPASVTDSPGASGAPDETVVVTTPADSSQLASASDNGDVDASGMAGSADSSSSTQSTRSAHGPVRSDAVQPAATTVQDSGFPVLAVVLIVIVVAALAAGGFLFYRRQHR